MSMFLSDNGDGSYGLSGAGIALSAAIFFVLLVLAALAVYRPQSQKRMTAKQLTYCAIAVALGAVLSMLKVYKFPFGGSVTAFSMLLICLPGWLYGVRTGILTGLTYGVLQLILEPYILFPAQVAVDYLFAFGALGLSGLFMNARGGLTKGYLAGVCGRYVFAVLSGWIFFGTYAWEGWAPLPYSMAYNAAYIFAEAAATVLVLQIPPFKKALEGIKKSA